MCPSVSLLIPILLLALICPSNARGGAPASIPTSRLHLPPVQAEPRLRPLRADTVRRVEAEIVNPAEFCRAEAMVIYWKSWHSRELVDLCLAVASDDRVVCCVSSASQQDEAFHAMAARGVNLTNVEFFQTVSATVWIRDYGPFSTYIDGALSIADLRYPGSSDPIPVYLALHEELPWYQSLLAHAGGNHITDGNGMGFCSAKLLTSNSSWTSESIRSEMRDYLGLDSLVILPTLQGDLTEHCDMFVKLLNDTLFAVGEYANPGDGIGNDYEVLNELARDLDAMKNLDGRDFEVVRLPMNPIIPGTYSINRTYTNSFLFNDKVLVPVYGTALDDAALQIYAACMPGYEIIGIDSEDLIQYLGAVHCICNTIHDANPLTILHEPQLSALAGETPVLRCRLNPRFSDCAVELYHTATIDGLPQVVPANLSGGIWRAQIPPVSETFDYWLVARAYTGTGVIETTLPAEAPLEVFTCEVDAPASVATQVHHAPLATVRPNPFGSDARVAFTLLRGTVVNAAVYDVSGGIARRLLTSVLLPSGRHEIAWHGEDDAGRALPGGIYFVSLQAGNVGTRQKVVLVR